jgi:putative tryptophan/tyrosine transport system substrate-binding protein
MQRRTFAGLAGAAVLALSFGVLAQGAAARRRIGFLSAFAQGEVETVRGELARELAKLGWVDGRTIEFLHVRTTEGRNERLPSMAAELVAERPDLILVQSIPATRAAMQATTSIPIVMIGVASPVEVGIIPDYGRPGGNVTGASYLADESLRKLLQFLKEAVPRLRSVAVFTNPSNPAAAATVRALDAEAARLGVRLQNVEVSGNNDFAGAFDAIRRANTEAILLPPEPLIRANRAAIADFAQAHRLPLAVTGSSRYLPAHGLISYGPTTTQYAQIVARYVDRIFRGVHPGDLPVEQPSRLELAIHLDTAKALGLTIPQSLLERAKPTD